MVLRAPEELIFTMLCDYERAPELFRNLSTSTVQRQVRGLKRPGRRGTAEAQLCFASGRASSGTGCEQRTRFSRRRVSGGRTLRTIPRCSASALPATRAPMQRPSCGAVPGGRWQVSRMTRGVQGDDVEVRQTCTWRFLVFKGTFELVLAVTELAARRELLFKLKRSQFMKDFEGRWQLHPNPDGTCSVVHTLSVSPTMVPPEAFAGYTSKIFVRQVHGILSDLHAGVQREVATGR